MISDLVMPLAPAARMISFNPLQMRFSLSIGHMPLDRLHGALRIVAHEIDRPIRCCDSSISGLAGSRPTATISASLSAFSPMRAKIAVNAVPAADRNSSVNSTLSWRNRARASSVIGTIIGFTAVF